MAKRYLKENKGTEVIQEHSKSNLDPTAKRPARPHSPDRPSHLEHRVDTTRPRYILPHESSNRPLLCSRTVMTCSISFSAGGSSRPADPFDCAFTWLSEAVPSVAAEFRAYPCLGVLCMTACRDGPQTLVLFSRLRAKGVLCSQDSLVRVLI